MGSAKRKAGSLYLHADRDSFFVACELSVRPELRGKPVIVGADRGIAVAMKPEAKKLGITRGMPVFRIKKLFPQVVVLPHDFELYNRVAQGMLSILSSYFRDVEVYSIDECFALVRPSEAKYFGGEENLLMELKKEIEGTLSVTYSLGLARTKALSKLASKLEKPGGVVMLLTKADEVDALKRTNVEDIWGIGRQTYPKLKALGIQTAYDFVNYPDSKIAREFSRPTMDMKRELAGEEILEVVSDADPRDQKSIQSTATFRPARSEERRVGKEGRS